jgi:hypothetical protein
MATFPQRSATFDFSAAPAASCICYQWRCSSGRASFRYNNNNWILFYSSRASRRAALWMVGGTLQSEGRPPPPPPLLPPPPPQQQQPRGRARALANLKPKMRMCKPCQSTRMSRLIQRCDAPAVWSCAELMSDCWSVCLPHHCEFYERALSIFKQTQVQSDPIQFYCASGSGVYNQQQKLKRFHEGLDEAKVTPPFPTALLATQHLIRALCFAAFRSPAQKVCVAFRGVGG